MSVDVSYGVCCGVAFGNRVFRKTDHQIIMLFITVCLSSGRLIASIWNYFSDKKFD